MARLLSTSPAILAPKTANTFIPIETPQKSVPTADYLAVWRPRDLGELPEAGGFLQGTGGAGVTVVNPT
jgi:hypothetical protein